MKAKAVNYTEAQVAVLTEMYKGVDNATEVAEIAKATGKSAASVRAKLASLGLYAKAEAESKAKGITKRALAEQVGNALGLQEFEVDALEKTSKSVLDKLVAKLVSE